jgi:hypothetical protein
VTCAVGNDAKDVGVGWGSFFGAGSDYLGMHVDVTVSHTPAPGRTSIRSGEPELAAAPAMAR